MNAAPGTTGHRLSTRPTLLCLLALAIVCAGGLAESLYFTAKGNPDGAGGIPYAGATRVLFGMKPPYFMTLVQVVDSAQVAIPDVPLVVMTNSGTIVAAGVTSDRGLFAVDLPAIPSLTISLPMNGVNELPIQAGVPVLIVVR